jgi:hypothetical protein
MRAILNKDFQAFGSHDTKNYNTSKGRLRKYKGDGVFDLVS